MTAPAVSVVVVSRDRPEALALCLAGLSQIYYPNFEIIVVGNKNSMSGVDSDPIWGQLKKVEFDVPNISAARNLGVAEAAGEIIAFIDDDAVPEPTWLGHLIAPFHEQKVAAAGGYVLGRNGISFQWKARMAFPDGVCTDLLIDGDAPRVFVGAPGRAIKTEGTNMAIRRDVLETLGGFDEAFQYYLDETDLNMRLAEGGFQTAIVPLAQVHHGYAASDKRTGTRVPKDLTHVGRSTALFARKHGADLSAVRVSLMDERRAWILRMFVRGDLVASDVRRLMTSLEVGWQDGESGEVGRHRVASDPPPFVKFESPFVESTMVQDLGRFWQRPKKLEVAKMALKRGERVSILLLSYSALFHQTRFELPGIWVQTGGQFGRSDRWGPLFRLFSARRRQRHEIDRIAKVRSNAVL